LRSPGAGSTTAVRSSTAVTQTRRPSSTSASKSGRISSSSSRVTASRRTSSLAVFDGVPPRFRFESMLISQIPDQKHTQTQQKPRDQMRWKQSKQLRSEEHTSELQSLAY